MSNAVSPLEGASHTGFATIAEAGLRGMITVRGDLGSKAMAAALEAAGAAVPAARRIVLKGDRGAAWMSLDEVLVLCPYEDAAATVAALESALKDDHALVADVSDARATFTVAGPRADQVLRKLSPADIDRLAEGEVRRTRLAQVAAAFWRSGDGEFTLVTFRSVAGYVFPLLTVAAREGTALT